MPLLSLPLALVVLLLLPPASVAITIRLSSLLSVPFPVCLYSSFR